MLGKQTTLADQYAGTMGNRGTEAYNQANDIRNWELGQYKDLYGNTLNGGGGGGGGGYNTSDLMDFWQNLMTTGGYGDTEKGLVQSAAAAPIQGMYEGVARDLGSRMAGAGMPSYSSGIGSLLRDQAYAGSEASKKAMSDMIDKIIANKETGAGHVQDLRATAAANAMANSRYNDQLQLEYLSRIQGLMPSDLPYNSAQLGGLGQATGTITGRQDETPLWQKSLASVFPSAASAAIGAFTGGFGGKPGVSMPYGGGASIVPSNLGSNPNLWS